MSDDFFADYIKYTTDTEVPTFFHRWVALSAVGTLLSRNIHFKLGHTNIYPNMYIMLIGVAGTRKSTAISIMRKLMKGIGYNNIAADKTSKEKFLLDLSQGFGVEEEAESILDKNLWGNLKADENSVVECYIMADEFNNFLGNGNIEFISLLGTLWDYEGTYENKIKNSPSNFISNPTISMLGGNTPTGFSLAFPPDVIGQGFFSRLLLIYGEPTGKRITFPVAPSVEETKHIQECMVRIQTQLVGESNFTKSAKSLLDKIYKTWQGIDDVRFDSYANRRFTHLLKLCIIQAAARYSIEVTERDVIYANTVLTHTEYLMPKALGEFGKAKHSDVSHKVLQLLSSAHGVLTLTDIWQHVHNDLEKIADLGEILRNLIVADKIQNPTGIGGYLVKRKVLNEVSNDVLDYSLLTKEEKEIGK